MNNPITAFVLPVIRVHAQHNGKALEKYFTLDGINDHPSLLPAFQKADAWLESMGKSRTDANIYLINRVNGEWRTDWQMADNFRVLRHPWSTIRDELHPTSISSIVHPVIESQTP
jgi:hypothetical protein